MYENIKQVGLPQWSEDDQTLAKAVQKELKVPERGLGDPSCEACRAGHAKRGPRGGSDDIGDVSWNVPTVVLSYPSNIPNLPGHNWSNAIAMATPIAHKGVTAGAKVAGDDDDRSADETGARRAGVELFSRSADERHEVSAAHSAAGQAGRSG